MQAKGKARRDAKEGDIIVGGGGGRDNFDCQGLGFADFFAMACDEKNKMRHCRRGIPYRTQPQEQQVLGENAKIIDIKSENKR